MNVATMKRKMIQVSNAIKEEKCGLKDETLDNETRAMHQAKLYQLRDLYRSMHIAYGIRRCRSYDTMERSCEICPDWSKVVVYLTRMGFKPELYTSKEKEDDVETLNLPPVLQAFYDIDGASSCNKRS